MYREVLEGGQGEIVEKKSRFIATVFPISNEDEAVNIIEQMRKKYWDARHNCYAYVCGINNEIMKFSDDGEPSQTAGKPMLDIITSRELRNVLVVVTRYFGGELLGTGGLVRAYQQSTKAGIDESILLDMEDNVILKIISNYNDIGKIKYIVASEKYETASSEYGENVEETILVPADKKDIFIAKVTQATSARAKFKEVARGYYAVYNGKIIKSRSC